jgi:hypothetical protein
MTPWEEMAIRQGVWSDTADNLKRNLVRARWITLCLSVLGAMPHRHSSAKLSNSRPGQPPTMKSRIASSGSTRSARGLNVMSMISSIGSMARHRLHAAGEEAAASRSSTGAAALHHRSHYRGVKLFKCQSLAVCRAAPPSQASSGFRTTSVSLTDSVSQLNHETAAITARSTRAVT